VEAIILFDLTHSTIGIADELLASVKCCSMISPVSAQAVKVALGNSDNTVLIVNAARGNVLTSYNGHSNWVKDVAWSPNGKHIASGSDDGGVILWDTANGANIYTYNGHSGHINAVGWSPNGKLIASGGDTVQVWEAS
jgi:WD40 repeat protein